MERIHRFKEFSLDLSQYDMVLSLHAKKMIREKGFDPGLVEETYLNPKRVYPSGSHPGQYRITGNGLCLVGEPDEMRGQFIVITIYEDEVLTPPRPDQLNTPEGRLYADRYYKGLGRGKN